MNQFAVLAVAEKVSRLDAEAELAYLEVMERLGEEIASERGQSLEDAARAVLDKAAGNRAQESVRAKGIP